MSPINQLYEIFKQCNQRIFTDTRKLEAGAIFFALKGENFNGNLFAKQAIESGASYAIVDELIEENERFIMVDDVLTTLQKLANHHRKVLKTKIIAIGGSNGKTTTKELLNLVLSKKYKTYSTVGNFNNHIGVPLTLLKLQSDHELAIIEFGANKAGDIQELCDIALPEFGLITNIGKEHLEGFGSIEGVAKAESELFDFLIKNNGISFVNRDDIWLENMSKRMRDFRTYTTENSEIQDLETVPQIAFRYKGVLFESCLPGRHNLQNIMAAICIGEYFEVTLDDMASAIHAYSPQNNRSQFIQTSHGNQILLDAYNANPSSVEVALNTFDEMKHDTKLVVLGDMFELGKHELEEHQYILDLCANKFNFQEVVLVGKAFARCQNTNPRIKIFENKPDALVYFKEKRYQKLKVLLKGSRGMKMEDFKDCF
ncbi:MAG: UDP-N-acetylmuramoyl-tripeptide--D-alanyl-D-alanine ligase [Bacteroidota bacterium]|nr:UDP-N-acetylmuramoyl-tripeptide--D-alanyl-D-alanine ligase [Bacteroidota bacterium]